MAPIISAMRANYRDNVVADGRIVNRQHSRDGPNGPPRTRVYTTYFPHPPETPLRRDSYV